MKYIYGPVKSRRLGLSLGVSLFPYKTCNFDCIYCQLGRTEILTHEKKEYVKAQDILLELQTWIREHSLEAEKLDFITLSGSGEPLLYEEIKEVISGIKKLSSVKVAVITNASLLHEAGVRSSLAEADLIVPSLDSVTPEVFHKIDRPHSSVDINQVINGLIELRKEFRGKIWLEVMIVRGVNDGLAEIRKLKEVAERIKPDKIQINSPVRSTTEEEIIPVDKKRLQGIKEVLGGKCEII